MFPHKRAYFSNNSNYAITHTRIKSSYQRCSMKKGVLRNFTKFTVKYLCQSLFFNRVVGLRPVNLLKKRLKHRCFPVNFAKFLRIPFLQDTSGRLLPKNADGNTKFHMTRLNPWKLTFLANKYKVKAKNFIIPIFYFLVLFLWWVACCNTSTSSFFFEDFFKGSKEQIIINEIWKLI